MKKNSISASEMDKYCKADIEITEMIYDLLTNPLKNEPIHSSFIDGTIFHLESLKEVDNDKN